MGDANKVVSLLVGLFVVIVIFSVVASRIGLSDRLRGLQTRSEDTLTPTPTLVVTETINIKKQLNGESVTVETTTDSSAPVETVVVQNQGNNDGVASYTAPIEKSGTVVTTSDSMASAKQIPATGASTAVLPLALSGLLVGTYLRRKY